jgi:hypothetical protein
MTFFRAFFSDSDAKLGIPDKLWDHGERRPAEAEYANT